MKKTERRFEYDIVYAVGWGGGGEWLTVLVRMNAIYEELFFSFRIEIATGPND